MTENNLKPPQTLLSCLAGGKRETTCGNQEKKTGVIYTVLAKTTKAQQKEPSA
jgi:hypothetical protein